MHAGCPFLAFGQRGSISLFTSWTRHLFSVAASIKQMHKLSNTGIGAVLWAPAVATSIKEIHKLTNTGRGCIVGPGCCNLHQRNT